MDNAQIGYCSVEKTGKIKKIQVQRCEKYCAIFRVNYKLFDRFFITVVSPPTKLELPFLQMKKFLNLEQQNRNYGKFVRLGSQNHKLTRKKTQHT